MKATHKPKAGKALSVEEQGNGIVLHFAHTAHAIKLNATAAKIWRCCDGTRTVAEIAVLMADDFPDHKEDFSNDVVSCLQNLEELGAIDHWECDPQPDDPVVYPMPSSIAFKVDGLGCFYGFKRDLISSFIEKNQIWEQYLHPIFEEYIKPGDTVLDAGCYIGTHTIKFAQLCAPGTVLAFEPHPDICKVARANVETNGIANVQLFEKGLSDAPGGVSYAWISGDNLAASGLDNNPKGIPGGPDVARARERKLSISLTSVDQLRLERLDFLKIDVEGYEIKVLRGAETTLARCRPVVVLECWKSNMERDRGLVEDLDNLAPDSPLRFLKDRDYSIKPITGPDFLALPDRLTAPDIA